MSKDSFDAISWLQKENFSLNSNSINKNGNFFFSEKLNSSNDVSPPATMNKTSHTKSLDEQTNSIIAHLMPLLRPLQSDVSKNFNFNYFNRNTRSGIHQEFISFCREQEIEIRDLETLNAFAQHLGWPQSPFRSLLNRFFEIYFLRVACFYFFKLRFITELAFHTNINLAHKQYANINNFISQTFVKGGPTELYCSALQMNYYSWYCPTEHLGDLLHKLSVLSKKISFLEFLQSFADSLFYQKRQDILHRSPSLANKPFANILETLLKRLPEWLKKGTSTTKTHAGPEEKNISFSFNYDDFLSAPSLSEAPIISPLDSISCKVSGDFIDSFSLALWRNLLTNDPNVSILYPHFEEGNEHNDPYFKLIFELQLITYLIGVAKNYNDQAISFLCKVMKQRHQKEFYHRGEQITIFSNTNDTNISNGLNKYQRILVNLHHFPKNNPLPYLANKIIENASSLSDDGLLFVFSAKKLFIHSLKEKVYQILEILKLECTVSFDALKNKGEIPSFLYIFSKKSKGMEVFEGDDFLSNSTQGFSKKIPCYSFRIHGEMAELKTLDIIDNAFQSFFANKKVDLTPVFQIEPERGLLFQFYQDAIMDGLLINSSSKDSSQITHPTFFKHLIKSCSPLENFFYIETIKSGRTKSEQKSKNNDFLSSLSSLFETEENNDLFSIDRDEDNNEDHLDLYFNQENNYSYFLVLNCRREDQIRIEILNFDSYRQYRQEYGITAQHYFGLIPKIPALNIGHFKSFFSSPIGKQIIQLSLNGQVSKLKAKISSILIPRFFAKPVPLPRIYIDQLAFFTSSKEQFLARNPEELIRFFEDKKSLLQTMVTQFPWAILSLLGHFQASINALNSLFTTSIQEEGQEQQTAEQAFNQVDFKHPMIIKELVKISNFPIHPNHPDFFLEKHFKDVREIHRPFGHSVLKRGGHTDIFEMSPKKQTPFLEIYSTEKMVLKIYSEWESLLFVNFLLSNYEKVKNVPIAQILQALKVPGHRDLKTIIERFQKQRKYYHFLSLQTEQIIFHIFKQQINTEELSSPLSAQNRIETDPFTFLN